MNALFPPLPLSEKTAAQAEGDPCCDWVGETGAGHYVKMVHNGIEYGDMQLIAEAYDILKRGLGLHEKEIADIFDKVGGWSKSEIILMSDVVECVLLLLWNVFCPKTVELWCPRLFLDRDHP